MKLIATIRISEQVTEDRYDVISRNYEIGEKETVQELFNRIKKLNEKYHSSELITIHQLYNFVEGSYE